jgi:hypothetical protein
MNSRSSLFETFGALVQFYPKLSASIALGVMAIAVNSMKAFSSVGNKSAELIDTTPLPSHPIPARVRSPLQRKDKRPARKSKKRSTRRHRAA